MTQSTNRPIHNNEIFLIDSGGQYPDGTTDVTRTVIVGKATDEMKDRFTRVLKGHIALATVRFPEGTTRRRARRLCAQRRLWDAGLDYDHGTGHGVGSVILSVHEGPQNISKRHVTQPLKPGMICSNEPGYYKNGEYGIRIENLIVVTRGQAGPRRRPTAQVHGIRDHHARAHRSRPGRAQATDRRTNAPGSTPTTPACARRFCPAGG